MGDPFIDKLNEKHLCSWYILPLLGLNVEEFGITNFKNAFQIQSSAAEAENTYKIGVLVYNMNKCIKVTTNPHYYGQFDTREGHLLVFEIPESSRYDYRMFVAGRYSKMSKTAKDLIRTYSGLKFEIPDENGDKRTDAVLLALDRHVVLKEMWMSILGVQERDLPDELLSSPTSTSFINLKI